MIRYRAEPEGRDPIIFLGLSDMNVTRLRAGQPICIDADDRVGLGVEVVIYHGATEVDLTRELEEHGILPKGAAGDVAQAALASVERRRGEPVISPEEGAQIESGWA